MSMNEKDFITRIQVSQLVNQLGPGGSHDPYVEDFYFHVYNAIRASRGPPPPQQNAAQTGGKQARPSKRENALSRMAQQVQRIVADSAKKPKKDQGALSSGCRRCDRAAWQLVAVLSTRA